MRGGPTGPINRTRCGAMRRRGSCATKDHMQWWSDRVVDDSITRQTIDSNSTVALLVLMLSNARNGSAQYEKGASLLYCFPIICTMADIFYLACT